MAPADVLVTDPAYRSQQAASEGDPFSAVYSADVELDKPGEWAVLIATQSGGQMTATPAGVKVAKSSVLRRSATRHRWSTPTPSRAPAATSKKIDTRLPPSDMHGNFRDVVGKKPVALLFATPQLCQSRVCGPVVDIAAQLKEKYGDQMEFIHQEVYVDNEVDKGLRPPLQKYKLQTEPWLFVVGADGLVKARLEGSFGLDAFERAVQAGLKVLVRAQRLGVTGVVEDDGVADTPRGAAAAGCRPGRARTGGPGSRRIAVREDGGAEDGRLQDGARRSTHSHEPGRVRALACCRRGRRAPVVMWVHGGAYRAGDKGNTARPKARLFNRRGWVFVSVNYRLTRPGVSWSASWPDHFRESPLQCAGPAATSDAAAEFVVGSPYSATRPGRTQSRT